MNDTVVICWKDSQHLVKQFRCVDPLESWKSIRSKSVQTLYNLYSPVLPVLRWEKELILSNDLFMTTFAKILNEGKRILRTGGSVVFPAETSWGKNIQHLRSLPFAKPYTISFTHSFPFPPHVSHGPIIVINPNGVCCCVCRIPFPPQLLQFCRVPPFPAQSTHKISRFILSLNFFPLYKSTRLTPIS